jgi:hypothetical protein
LLDLSSVLFGFSDFASERAGPLGISAPFSFGERPPLSEFPVSCFFDECEEPIHRQLTVPILGARLLHRHRGTRRSMNEGNSGGDLVDILAARSARTRKNLFELFRAQPETAHSIGKVWVGAEHAGV